MSEPNVHCDKCGRPYYDQSYDIAFGGFAPRFHIRSVNFPDFPERPQGKLCEECYKIASRDEETKWRNKTHEVTKWKKCGTCNGRGRVKSYKCVDCNGKKGWYITDRIAD